MSSIGSLENLALAEVIEPAGELQGVRQTSPCVVSGHVMLALDSPRWMELDDSYGDASQVPSLLESLYDGDGAVLESLHSSICHQGSTYGGSYAAVPHLVAAAKRVVDVQLRAEILALVGCIRASIDNRSRTTLSEDIADGYHEALPAALELALATLTVPLEPSLSVYLLEAAAALKGYDGLGRILSGFVDREFTTACPTCARDLYIWPGDGGLVVAAEDPVSHPKTTRTPVLPGPTGSKTMVQAYAWLRDVAGPPALSLIGEHLPYLFGTAVCPACEARFALIEELVDDAA